jgi:hypothetical protein
MKLNWFLVVKLDAQSVGLFYENKASILGLRMCFYLRVIALGMTTKYLFYLLMR